ncbi:MAG: flagellar hook assembly protein FlgD [Panacagrimonas sp.]
MSVASVNETFSNLGLAVRQSGNGRTELGQDAFLKLMTTQLQNQDPFKPMESGEFLGQIAQFSTVSGIQGMQESLAGLSSALTSNQTLQAAAMVGRGVMVPGDSAFLFDEGSLSGAAELPTSGDLTVEITDSAGQVVRRIELGTQSAGTTPFAWDGLDEAGTRLPEGSYGFRAQLDVGGATSSVSTLAVGLVNSVSLGANGLTLNLFGMDPVALTEVREIL